MDFDFLPTEFVLFYAVGKVTAYLTALERL
jgi:hypothetical protein